MIIYTILFSTYTPQNVFLIYGALITIAGGDLMDVDWIFEIFGYVETEPYNDNFNEAKFGGSNFVENMGFLLPASIILLVYHVIRSTALHFALKRMNEDEVLCPRKVHAIFGGQTIWLDTLLRYFLEGYVEFVICGLLTVFYIHQPEKFSSFHESFSTGLGLVFLLYCSMMPLHILWIAYNYKKSLEQCKTELTKE